MYLFITIFFLICFLFSIFFFYRRKIIINKLCRMSRCDKIALFNELAEPFGFLYLPQQDIVTSKPDSWQREYGYSFLYDESAPHFNMIFDCEPVYFNYNNRTWLIEFWKGQYGLSLGAEIGIYHADRILSPHEYDKSFFTCASDDELMPLSMNINFKGQHLFSVHHNHWWLTGFCIGYFANPEDLTTELSLTFPNKIMLDHFVKSLQSIGYSICDMDICCNTISLCFCSPHTYQPRMSMPVCVWFSQLKNRLICRLYRWITRPFTCTLERILFLYFFLPFTFRKTFYFRKNKKQKLSRKNRKKSI